MKPTANKILVRKEEDKKGVQGNSVMVATVLAVGRLVKEVKVGDKVTFSPYGFDEVIVGKDKLIVIVEELILGIYEKDNSTKAKR